MFKQFILVLLAGISVIAEDLPAAGKILTHARQQLPTAPVRLTGALKDRAPNGFVRRELAIEMDLYWGENPPRAAYRIQDKKTHSLELLEIKWKNSGAVFDYVKNGIPAPEFNPADEIGGIGITWSDLSFSFLWSKDAKTVETGRRLGRDCYVISVPRDDKQLRLWIEKDSGRMLGAKEQNAAGKLIKEIKVISVKEFDGLWMVKDLDIIHPAENRRASLRIETVEPLE